VVVWSESVGQRARRPGGVGQVSVTHDFVMKILKLPT